MENSDIEISKRIKSLRKDRRLTQRQLAEILEVTQPTLSDIERGRIGASTRIIKRLSEKLDISIDWILHGKNGLNIDSTDNCVPDYTLHQSSLPGFNNISDRFRSDDISQQLEELIRDQIALVDSYMLADLHQSAILARDIGEEDNEEYDALSRLIDSFNSFFDQFRVSHVWRTESPYLRMGIKAKLQILKAICAAQSKVLSFTFDFLREASNRVYNQDHHK
ncbi:MAG: helix-turn-helix transcriptional regulator [Bacteroides sp.]|nr:helix-turn-helix transcriptional regulator [Bacteroides sp.]